MTRILIADDDPSLRSLLGLIARRAGYTVDTVGDGAAALEQLRSHEYTLILLDLMMPVRNGYEVIAALRSMARRPGVLVVTAMSDHDLEGLDATVVQSVICKPFDVATVAAVIKDLATTLEEERGVQTTILAFPERHGV
jgi:two-component system, OmpR family, alkaline phosphatase synthesis response regulator PhoP